MGKPSKNKYPHLINLGSPFTMKSSPYNLTENQSTELDSNKDGELTASDFKTLGESPNDMKSPAKMYGKNK